MQALNVKLLDRKREIRPTEIGQVEFILVSSLWRMLPSCSVPPLNQNRALAHSGVAFAACGRWGLKLGCLLECSKTAVNRRSLPVPPCPSPSLLQLGTGLPGLGFAWSPSLSHEIFSEPRGCGATFPLSFNSISKKTWPVWDLL